MSVQEDFAQRLKTWNSASIQYMALGVALLAASILCNAVITVFADAISSTAVKILSFLSAAATALLARFNPLEIGFKFRDAWRLLDSASLRHAATPDKFPVEKVLDAIDKGEALIASASRPSIGPSPT